MSKEGVSFKNRDRFIQLGIAISTLRKLRGMSQDQLAHAGGAGVFQIGIQEKCGLANTAGADHKAVDVIAVHQCGELLWLPLATEDQSLLRGEILSFAPLSDLEGYMGIGLPDFLVGSPSGCAVLPITDCFGFNAVQVIDVRQQGDSTQHAEHNRSDHD